MRSPYGIAVTSTSRVQDDFFPHRAFPPPSPLLDSESSVETGTSSPSSAALSVCHGSDAHFTRTGNSETPENTASLPSSGAAARSFWSGKR